MKALALLGGLTWATLWFTPDQLGALYFARADYAAAAAAFRDPSWAGAAWYRAGEFGKAAAAFARGHGAEADYNEGNARLMLGDYAAAIACYERALQQRPGWREAETNRALAAARAALRERRGEDLGDQRVGADDIVFDAQARERGQDTTVSADAVLSDEAIQALWLRRVQTRPADFLRARFAYQQAQREAETAP